MTNEYHGCERCASSSACVFLLNVHSYVRQNGQMALFDFPLLRTLVERYTERKRQLALLSAHSHTKTTLMYFWVNDVPAYLPQRTLFLVCVIITNTQTDTFNCLLQYAACVQSKYMCDNIILI